MITRFNVFRYLIAILLPASLMFWHPVAVIVAVLVVLYLNNVLDDLFFYYGSLFVSTKGYKGGIASPVNGIVTKVEKDVRLFSHLDKKDCLTKYDAFDGLKFTTPLSENFPVTKLNHLTIFLNKLNHHIVANIGERLEHLQELSLNGEPADMVTHGNLTATNKGEYLTNPFIVLQYRSAIVVLTLDRYISKFVPGETKPLGFEGFICRGSQADIYTQGEVLVNEGDVVQVFDTIAESELNVLNPSIPHPLSLIKKCLPNGTKEIWLENANKTISTFCNPVISVLFSFGVVASFYYSWPLFLSAGILYLFLFERSYKHLMYALMNSTKYKESYTTTYRIVSKIAFLWRSSK